MKNTPESRIACTDIPECDDTKLRDWPYTRVPADFHLVCPACTQRIDGLTYLVEKGTTTVLQESPVTVTSRSTDQVTGWTAHPCGDQLASAEWRLTVIPAELVAEFRPLIAPVHG